MPLFPPSTGTAPTTTATTAAVPTALAADGPTLAQLRERWADPLLVDDHATQDGGPEAGMVDWASRPSTLAGSGGSGGARAASAAGSDQSMDGDLLSAAASTGGYRTRRGGSFAHGEHRDGRHGAHATDVMLMGSGTRTGSLLDDMVGVTAGPLLLDLSPPARLSATGSVGSSGGATSQATPPEYAWRPASVVGDTWRHLGPTAPAVVLRSSGGTSPATTTASVTMATAGGTGGSSSIAGTGGGPALMALPTGRQRRLSDGDRAGASAYRPRGASTAAAPKLVV
jgi:hypothetical protein